MKYYLILVIALFVTFVGQAQNFKRYPFKSGIIHYQFEGKTTGTEVLYFDEYGKYEARYTKTMTKVFGVLTKEDKISLLKEAEQIEYDRLTNEYTQMTNPLYESFSQNESLNYEEFGEDAIEKMGYRKIGQSTVLGKECDVWNGIGKLYTWRALTLKLEMKVMGVNFVQTATNLKLDVPIEASLFDLPENASLKKSYNIWDAPGDLGDDDYSDDDTYDDEKTIADDQPNLQNFFKAFEESGIRDKKEFKEGMDKLKNLFGGAGDSEISTDIDLSEQEELPDFLSQMMAGVEEGKTTLCEMDFSDFKREFLKNDRSKSEKEMKDMYKILEDFCNE